MSRPVMTSTAAAGSGPADLLLVQQALRGELGAVDVLLGRLGCIPRFVYRLNRVCGHGLPTEALEDVVQAVYAALWPRLREFHGNNPIETWVFAFCRNCLRSAARRGQKHRTLPAEALSMMAAPGWDGPDQELHRQETLAALRDELAELPDDERAAVEARHLGGNSFEDLARQSGVAVSTIKDRCYRAMQRLQQRLGKRLASG